MYCCSCFEKSCYRKIVFNDKETQVIITPRKQRGFFEGSHSTKQKQKQKKTKKSFLKEKFNKNCQKWSP